MLTSSQSEVDLKRLKRKQSNRESARRSRMKKQAEVEGLVAKLGELKSENGSMRSALAIAHNLLARMVAEKAALMAQVTALGGEVPAGMDWSQNGLGGPGGALPAGLQLAGPGAAGGAAPPS